MLQYIQLILHQATRKHWKISEVEPKSYHLSLYSMLHCRLWHTGGVATLLLSLGYWTVDLWFLPFVFFPFSVYLVTFLSFLSFVLCIVLEILFSATFPSNWIFLFAGVSFYHNKIFYWHQITNDRGRWEKAICSPAGPFSFTNGIAFVTLVVAHTHEP